MTVGWIWLFLVLAGGLFVLKMIYVASTALALPATGGALYVSTARARIAAALDAVPMHPGGTLVDLGCGDGRVLLLARRRYDIHALGYEVNPLAYLRARWKTCFQEGVSVRRQDFWHADLSPADYVTCYLFPDVMHRLAKKLRSELKNGTMVISFNFPLPGFPLLRTIRPPGALCGDPIYIYRVSQTAEGR